VKLWQVRSPAFSPDRHFGNSELPDFNYYSNYSALGGTLGRFGYYGWYDHQQTDGFREANSDFFLNAWGAMFALDATGPLRWYLSFNAYDEVHGEPGGLTLT
jgi:Fe(3+) dicitrate transport protein